MVTALAQLVSGDLFLKNLNCCPAEKSVLGELDWFSGENFPSEIFPLEKFLMRKVSAEKSFNRKFSVGKSFHGKKFPSEIFRRKKFPLEIFRLKKFPTKTFCRKSFRRIFSTENFFWQNNFPRIKFPEFPPSGVNFP